MPEYKWHPIEDLPEELVSYSDSDLHLLKEEWQEVHDKTPQETLDQILNEIKREWAIETGKIEGLYTLTRGMTETLIKHGISAKLISHSSTNQDPEIVAAMLRDQEYVVEGLFDFVANRRNLSLSYIREIHQEFTRHQETTRAMTPDGNFVKIPLIKGDWKKSPNNPKQNDETIHEYSPPEQVASEMDRLLNMHHSHLEEGISPEVEAAFLHHRFTQIHPFQDGNGRVARALASLVLIQAGYFPFVVRDEERAEYIDALEEADNKNITELIQFIIEKQKELLYKALTEAQKLDVDRGISTIQERSNQYYENLTQNQERFTKSNSIVKTWRDIAMDVLQQYKTSLSETKTFKDNLAERFTFTDYPQIYENSSLFNGHIITESLCYTIAISFEMTDKELRLYIYSLGNSNIPENVSAHFRYHHGWEVGTFSYPLDHDERMGKYKFRGWFQEKLKPIIDEKFSFT